MSLCSQTDHTGLFAAPGLKRLLITAGSCTFVEGSAGQDVSSVGEAGASGADGPVLGRAGLGTLLAVHAPGGAHRAAAHVHTVPAGQRLATLVLMPLHETLLAAHVWTHRERSSELRPSHSRKHVWTNSIVDRTE